MRQLVAAFERIEAARGATTLTFFEYNALAALLIFAEHGVDVAVLEVGLGGRLDAANLVDADVAVVCSIGFDHRDWLGDTLEQIGAEKAGIFRAGRPAVLGTPRYAGERVLRHRGLRRARPRGRAGFQLADFACRASSRVGAIAELRMRLDDLPPSALAGSIQYRNAATALAALESLSEGRVTLRRDRCSRRSMRARSRPHSGGCGSPGRFQIVPGPVEWILDIAHNEPAAEVFAGAFSRSGHASGRTLAVVGILADKDAPAIAAALLAAVDDLDSAAALRGPRGSSAAAAGRRRDGPVCIAPRS